MARYRKKPVIIEAIQWTGENLEEIKVFTSNRIKYEPINGILLIPTLEGVLKASVKDFIIKGIVNEFYPCKPAIFKATYEEVKK